MSGLVLAGIDKSYGGVQALRGASLACADGKIHALIGERQMLEIAKALLRTPRVLVVDEPTSALLPTQVQWLFERVRAFAAGGGIAVFISHRLEEIEHLSHRVTVLRGGADVGTGTID